MKQADFKKWWYKLKPPADVLVDEIIWQYFAPHLKGELPREAIGEAASEWANSDNGIYVLVDALERLWNGDQEATTKCSFCLGTGECQGGDACHRSIIHDCPICKGTGKVCLRCGGSESVQKENRDPEDDEVEPCPDCTPVYQRKIGDEHYPSPNERKGEQRKGQERGYNLRSANIGEKFYLYMGDVGGDRRTGDRRRHG